MNRHHKNKVEIIPKALSSWASKENVEYQVYEYWGRKVKARRESQETAVAKIVETIPHETILDVGCGSGQYATVIGNFEHYVGLDNSKAFIEFCREKFIDDKRCEFYVWDVLYGDKWPGHFNLHLCLEVSRHANDPIGFYEILMDKVSADYHIISFATNPDADEVRSYSHGMLIGESHMYKYLDRFPKHALIHHDFPSEEDIGKLWWAVIQM
jgi:SAM-dependent methyltransferase